jgi:hypothetical protein
MIMSKYVKTCSAVCGALALAAVATADAANTTFPNRANSAVGSQSAAGFASTGGSQTLYFSYLLSAGRSYHAYGYIGYGPDALSGSCSVSWLDSAGAGVPGSSANGDEEPIDPGSDGDGLVVPLTPANTAIEFNIQLVTFGGATGGTTCFLRVVETTLFSPWFFREAGTGYDGFAEIHNNTRTSFPVTVTAWSPAGSVIGSTTQTLPANGTIFVTAGSLGAANTFGSMTIAHPAKVGAVSANMTTLSNATGLSFDSPFTTRDLSPRY